jgi:hypothetical protein
MDTRESGRTDSEPEPIKEFRGHGWFNVWGLLLAVLIGLVCACIYWIVRLGFWGALDNAQFGYEAFFAAALGILLIGRWSVPDLLVNGPTIDPRNANLFRRLSRRWWFRGSSGGKQVPDNRPPKTHLNEDEAAN